MDKQTKFVEDLVRSLRLCDYTVVEIGSTGRYQVNHPDKTDNRFTFMPKVLAERNLKAQINRLVREVGYDPEKGAQLLEEDRLRRIAASDQEAAIEAEKANRRRIRAGATLHVPEVTFTQPVEPLPAIIEAPITKEAPVRVANTENMTDLMQAVEELAQDSVLVGKHRFKEVIVDPEMAERILLHNREYRPPTIVGLHTMTNRPEHSAHILRAWAWDIVNGEWELIPHGVAFDSEGNLIDGQNRMKGLRIAGQEWESLLDRRLPGWESREAVLRQAGVSIPLVMSFDWDPNTTFARIDRGRMRGLGDLLAITGESDRHNLGTMARMLYAFDEDPDQQKPSVGDHILLPYVKANQPWLSEALVEGRPLRRIGLLITGAGAAIFVCRRAWPQTPEEIERDGDLMGDFLKSLVSGEDLSRGDPRLAMRNWLDSHPKENRRTHMALFIKTWNAWLEERKIVVMQLGRDRSFPVPIVRDGYVWSDAACRFVPGPDSDE